MALASTRHAIGAVDEMLRAQLTARTSAATVSVGRVESAADSDGPKLNLFLYGLDLDAHLRNRSLDAGQRAPLWLVLKYLLTAFDTGRDSDSTTAHELLGEGLLALDEMNFQRPAAAALADNPEPLKITFDAADVELLSRVMQGTDERFRVSGAFQVRPVLIAPSEPPAQAPLVLSVGPPGAEGVVVVPGLGPVIEMLDPPVFEAGDSVTVRGQGLDSGTHFVIVGDTRFPVTGAPEGSVTATVPPGTALSAGTYPVTVGRELPSGRLYASNALTGTLRPTLTGAVPAGALTAEGGGRFSGDLALTGVRLGGPGDGIFVAFWRDGAVATMVEATGSAAQTALTATVPPAQALPAGTYTVILRVNGAQARAMPQVDWS